MAEKSRRFNPLTGFRFRPIFLSFHFSASTIQNTTSQAMRNSLLRRLCMLLLGLQPYAITSSRAEMLTTSAIRTITSLRLLLIPNRRASTR